MKIIPKKVRRLVAFRGFGLLGCSTMASALNKAATLLISWLFHALLQRTMSAEFTPSWAAAAEKGSNDTINRPTRWGAPYHLLLG